MPCHIFSAMSNFKTKTVKLGLSLRSFNSCCLIKVHQMSKDTWVHHLAPGARASKTWGSAASINQLWRLCHLLPRFERAMHGSRRLGLCSVRAKSALVKGNPTAAVLRFVFRHGLANLVNGSPPMRNLHCRLTSQINHAYPVILYHLPPPPHPTPSPPLGPFLACLSFVVSAENVAVGTHSI